MNTDPAADADTADLTAAVRRLANARVLVIGDAMLDRYVYGAVERISPEAPVPVLKVEHDLAVPGGAANVVRNLGALKVLPKLTPEVMAQIDEISAPVTS